MDFFKMLQRTDNKAILASFTDPDQARRAKALLRANGIQEVDIDNISEQPSPETSITEPFPDTLSSAETDNERILDTATSAMSGLSTDELIQPQILLTVIADKHQYHKALSILRQFDAEI